MEENSFVVDGFVFSNKADAELAAKEQKNIEIIKQKTPLTDANASFSLYSKLIERDMFKTLVGVNFLHELRTHLINDFGYAEEELPPITFSTKSPKTIFEDIKREALEEKVNNLMLSRKKMAIVIIALVVMIVGMFVIAFVNPDVHYVNTENKLLNKYSGWAEELEAREAAVKEKEKELNIKE